MTKSIDDKISVYHVLNRLDDLILKLNPEEGVWTDPVKAHERLCEYKNELVYNLGVNARIKWERETKLPESSIQHTNLQEWLHKNKKTQCWLSESIKVSQPTISRWLNGQTIPLVHQAFEIEKLTNGEVTCNSWGTN